MVLVVLMLVVTVDFKSEDGSAACLARSVAALQLGLSLSLSSSGTAVSGVIAVL